MVDDFLEETPPRIVVSLDGRDVAIRSWRCEVRGVGSGVVPVYLLDTDLPENSFRRIRQESIGLGG